jgi:hypothetical protein
VIPTTTPIEIGLFSRISVKPTTTEIRTGFINSNNLNIKIKIFLEQMTNTTTLKTSINNQSKN